MIQSAKVVTIFSVLVFLYYCSHPIRVHGAHGAIKQNENGDGTIDIILDCDPAGLIATGLDVDDDLALMNLISMVFKPDTTPRVRLLGITITGGNAPLHFTLPNARHLVHNKLGQYDIEIHPGTPRSLSSFSKPFNSTEIESAATRFLIQTIHNSPYQSITVLSIGPLTNLAAAYVVDPTIANRLKQVVIMGGTMTPGMSYDLNMRSDPWAASIVYNELPSPKIAVPVETCVQAVFGPNEMKKVSLHCQESPSSIICLYQWRLWAQIQIMPWLVNWRFLAEGNVASKSIHQGFILWDLVALWALLRPELFDNWEYYSVEVEPLSSTILGKGRIRMEFTASSNDGSVQSSQNQVLIPTRIKNEEELVDLVLKNIFSLTDDSYYEQTDALSLWRCLGDLPKVLCTCLALVTVVRGIARVLQ